MRLTYWILHLLKRRMRPESGITRPQLFSFTLLICAVVIAYLNSLWGIFQFDDFNVIVKNPVVHSWQAWWLDIRQGIRPILKFTYTFDWTMGLGETGFHLTNMLIHLFNTLLVWQLSHRLVAIVCAQEVQPIIPLLAALLFAVHPVHTEAVTYICGRSSALMTLFYLAGLLFYIAGKAQHKQWYLHVLTPLCMVFALGVKETAVTFPFALLLWETYTGGSIRSAIRHQWTSWLLLAVSAIFFLFHASYFSMVVNSVELNSASGNVATQLLAFTYLLRQWLLPFWLNIDPDLPVLQNFAGLIPHLIILILVLMMLLLTFRRRPWLSFALAWTVLHLIPLYLFLPRMDVANDRQLYLVSWPLLAALVIELSLWFKPLVFRCSVGMIFVVLMSLTVMRNQDYRSEIALWKATVQLSPDKARVQNNLGYAYMLAGNIAEAQAAFEAALQLDPEYYKARYNLLRLYERASELAD